MISTAKSPILQVSFGLPLQYSPSLPTLSDSFSTSSHIISESVSVLPSCLFLCVCVSLYPPPQRLSVSVSLPADFASPSVLFVCICFSPIANMAFLSSVSPPTPKIFSLFLLKYHHPLFASVYPSLFVCMSISIPIY